MEKQKVCIYKWFIALMIGVLLFCTGAYFVFKYAELEILLLVLGFLEALYFIIFVPHSFIFEKEKIIAIYVFKRKTIPLKSVKRIEIQGSGPKIYPWGEYYYIMANKPYWDEMKIPKNKKTESFIKQIGLL